MGIDDEGSSNVPEDYTNMDDSISGDSVVFLGGAFTPATGSRALITEMSRPSFSTGELAALSISSSSIGSSVPVVHLH